MNFVIWLYLSKTGLLSTHAECSSLKDEQLRKTSSQPLEQLLDLSLHQLSQESAASPTAQTKCRPKPTIAQNQDDEQFDRNTCHLQVPPHAIDAYRLEFQDTMEFEKFRVEKLASMTQDILLKTYAGTDTAILHRNRDAQCKTMDVHMTDRHPEVCFAVVHSAAVKKTYNLVRVDQNIDIYGLSISNPDPSQVDKYSTKFALNKHNEGKFWPQGFFRKVPKERGRERTKDKLGTFLKHFDEINADFEAKVASHGIRAGDDLVAMVVNEGELDLFLNFACSCRLHNISMNNVLAFAGSSGIVPFIEATGAMALFHPGYASVSRRASTDYLDRVFVDMMWFKAFSIFLVLRHKINVLFQDVDLVWFREPMKYFHDYLRDHQAEMTMSGTPTLAFFSDDGQRSKRYTPYFAKSGFYYLIASPRSEYFAWSIMVAMDAIQVLGSHQNVFTTRLMEAISITAGHSKILSLGDFPTGIMYHHHRGYMKRLMEKKVSPYNFHMCWTQGKPDKLIYLRKASMWYLSETCSPLEALVEEPYDPQNRNKILPAGDVYKFSQTLQDLPTDEKWRRLGEKCCTSMPNAP
jgi:hypothetical protein